MAQDNVNRRDVTSCYVLFRLTFVNCPLILQPPVNSSRLSFLTLRAERWVGSVRRELLDHIIPINEYHLRWLGRDYLAYYHQDRTHIGLNKNTPDERAVETRSRFQTRIVSTSRLGGLHHRYRWSEAA